MLTNEQIKPLFSQPFDSVDLPLKNKHSGKIRESYTLDNGKRLIITTDRLSAFDRVLHCVPYKGQVLNQLSAWWFQQTTDIINNHLIDIPDPNALIATPAKPFTIEVIVRGYITGVTSTALWYQYEQGNREIYGYSFPENLKKNQALPEPIITPTTKGGVTGHDERLTCNEVITKGYLDENSWHIVQTAALALFKRGQEIAKKSGLLLVDTKYEFGYTNDGKIILIDEIHTPDSSRYWLANSYEKLFDTNKEPENFDKEFIRLAYAEQGYRGEGTPPELPEELWLNLSQRYITIYEMLTEEKFNPGSYPVMPRLLENLKFI